MPYERWAPKVVRSSSGIVAGLTAAALAAIGFLAYQASADVPSGLGSSRAADSSTTEAAKAPGTGSTRRHCPPRRARDDGSSTRWTTTAYGS